MKLLIIEGPDRCGKNTLIHNLVSQAENYVVRHFGTAKGDDDFEKRNHQFQFFKKEFELSSLRHRFEMPDKQRYPKDIWICNRGHLGEFVYGEMYRKTNPKDWVIRMEQEFMLDIDPSVYLLLLTAPSEFLCKRDDGLSFTADESKKQSEITRFFSAYYESKIMNRKILDVSSGDNYRPQESILQEVNDWLWPVKPANSEFYTKTIINSPIILEK